MGKPDVCQIEIEAGKRAVMREYGTVVGEQQAKNIAYHVLVDARSAKSEAEREVSG